MRKTTFAGLTVLGPTESILSDNGGFIGRDRDEIDRLGQIGAKLHRHDGSAGLTRPPIAPSAAILASGGTIDSGLTISLGYTLVDSVSGETTLSPLTAVSTPVALDPPEVAPVAEVDYTTGALDVDTYYYGITYIDGEGGETPLGDVAEVDREPGYPSGQVLLTELDDGMLDAGAVGWKLYRARGGGDFVLLTTGTGSTFDDDGSVSPDCDTHPPTDNVNTTNKISRLSVTLPSGSAFDDATFINLYGSLTGTFAEGSMLRQYPVASAGQTDIFTSLEFFDSQPPDTNRSYGGANKIDPDTELLDNHWKRPVATAGDLPGDAEEGDVRLVMDQGLGYRFVGSAWAAWGVASGIGGSPVNVTLLGAAGGGGGLFDNFDGPSLDDGWQMVVGPGIGELVIDSGELAPTATQVGDGEAAIYHEDSETGDSEVYYVKFHTGGTVGSEAGGIRASWLIDGDSSFVEVAIKDDDLILRTSYLGVSVAPEELAAAVGLSDDMDFWLGLIRDGDDITGEYWTTDPALGGSPDADGTYTLTSDNSDDTLHGAGTTGYAGIHFWPTDTDWRVDDFSIASLDGAVGDEEMTAITELRLQGASGIVVDGQEDPDGTGTVTISPLPRGWGSATAAGLASGASVDIDLDLGAAGVRLLKLSTNMRARVRVYGDDAARDADAARGPTVDPTGDHGVFLDYMNTDQAGGDLKRLSPIVDAHNTDEPALNKQYLRITNYQATGDLVVAFLYLPTEVA